MNESPRTAPSQAPQCFVQAMTRRRSVFKGAAALVFAALLGVPPLAAAADPNADNAAQRWVGTWAASPQAAEPPGATLEDQTVRQVVRTSVAGSMVRVRLSNEFGTTPLVIGAASVARHGGGAAIVAGSDVPLTFGGRPGITLAPGAPALSDPVDFDVPALGDVVVSIYLPKASVPRTVHSLATATTYISPPGNYAAAVVMPTAATAQSWLFFTGLTVDASRRNLAIVALGDSITDGYASTLDANRRWPDRLAARLQASARTAHLAVLNHGISGNRTSFDLVGPNVQARLDRDVLNAPGAGFVILLAGINNIGIPGAFGLTDQAVSADDIIAGHQQIIARARERGLKIFGGTLTPFEGTIFPGYYTPEGEAKRQAVNQWIRSSGAFDAVIDFDMAIRDPAQPTRMLPAYDSGDHLHPNDAGYQAMANFIDLRLFRRRGD
jgi:lysophospholipase L1-like esterase